MSIKWYIGLTTNNMYMVFSSSIIPTRNNTNFNNVIGPFKQKKEAFDYIEKRTYINKNVKKINVKNNCTLIKIYDKIKIIQAEKGSNSNWPHQLFQHKFTDGGEIYGLPNGDLLIKKGKKNKRLWKTFTY